MHTAMLKPACSSIGIVHSTTPIPSVYIVIVVWSRDGSVEANVEPHPLRTLPQGAKVVQGGLMAGVGDVQPLVERPQTYIAGILHNCRGLEDIHTIFQAIVPCTTIWLMVRVQEIWLLIRVPVL